VTKPLTPEGKRVLALTEQGLHERAVARRLGLTVRVVRMHVAAARQRARRRGEAAQ
jgi:DNA-binding CsgD family transcriptional regulator